MFVNLFDRTLKYSIAQLQCIMLLDGSLRTALRGKASAMYNLAVGVSGSRVGKLRCVV